ncbi:MAG: hypothetical protein ACREBG_03040 [Pyrinomonadaceae bacterium]
MKLHQFLSSVFALLALTNSSCDQTKRVEQFNPATPQLVWQYDTGG